MLYAKPSSAFTLALLLAAVQNVASAAPIPSRVASLQRSELLEDSVPVGWVEKMTLPLVSGLIHARDVLEPNALHQRSPSQHTFSVKDKTQNLRFVRKHPRELTPHARSMDNTEDKEVSQQSANCDDQKALDDAAQVPVLDELPSVLSDLVRPDLRRHPRDFLGSLEDTLTSKIGEPLLETVPKIIAGPTKIISGLRELPVGLVRRREHARDFNTLEQRDFISTDDILPNKPLQYLPVVGSELQSVSPSVSIKLLRKDSDSDSNSGENDDNDDSDKDKNDDNNEDEDRETPSSDKDFAKDASKAAMESHKAPTNRRSINFGNMNASLSARSNTNSAHTSETGARLRPDAKCSTT